MTDRNYTCSSQPLLAKNYDNDNHGHSHRRDENEIRIQPRLLALEFALSDPSSPRVIRTHYIGDANSFSKLSNAKIAAGYHLPPESTDDIACEKKHVPLNDPSCLGHGTSVAVIAGGAVSGVAPRANMLLVKESTVVLDQYGRKVRSAPNFSSNKVHGLDYIQNEIEQGWIPGNRAVIMMGTCAYVDEISQFDDNGRPSPSKLTHSIFALGSEIDTPTSQGNWMLDQ
ncbi:hypothetical protein MKZ38_002367 [Zalerion maritima]|uniref:Uncharacterized protein n=1 Tax=Zalerion maritima TaxID=339359 RepID=A0AAD5RYS2_9PEZI|nr:hypothetical protein MKZ38_002367 [Zalerion maritima]